jgi:hypothetical protein
MSAKSGWHFQNGPSIINKPRQLINQNALIGFQCSAIENSFSLSLSLSISCLLSSSEVLRRPFDVSRNWVEALKSGMEILIISKCGKLLACEFRLSVSSLSAVLKVNISNFQLSPGDRKR